VGMIGTIIKLSYHVYQSLIHSCVAINFNSTANEVIGKPIGIAEHKWFFREWHYYFFRFDRASRFKHS